MKYIIRPGSRLAAVALVALVWATAPRAEGALEACAAMLKYTGAPVTEGDEELRDPLCREGYVLEHHCERKEPEWVLEVLTLDRLKGPANRKKSSFKADKDLPPKCRSEKADYKTSGYDRGHMAPAADHKYKQSAMDNSFLLSNMAPQVGIGFNRGMWRRLETYVRNLVTGRDLLVVVSGPIYNGPKRTTKAGSTVRVPSHFYKIVYHPGRRRVLAFVLPNKKLKTQSLDRFVTTVREIEDETGYEFFPALSPRERGRLKVIHANLWRRFKP